MLTGVKDIDTIILNNLEDQDLVMVCRVNKLADRLCKDQMFWFNRILHKYPYLSLDILNKYKGDRSWSEYYINDLRKINPENANHHLIYGSNNDRLDQVIISMKMDANIHTDNDLPIIWASSNGRTNMVRYLVEAGADIHAQDEASLRLASENGHIDTVKYLVEAGADVRASDDAAIVEASNSGYIDIVRYLVEAGANIHAGDGEAIRLARRNGHIEVVNYLESLP